MAESSSKFPHSSTFTFAIPKTPASSSKQRRTSLALPSEDSPRLTPAWNFRDDTQLGGGSQTQGVPSELMGVLKVEPVDNMCLPPPPPPPPPPPKAAAAERKPRKKWTLEETQMLVDGCNIYGVGQWKAILNDPQFTFQDRTPVDLKDRFRTYYPDAYKQHYPNAKTHLSSKVRAANPDGTSIFEKTRSKRRRPFTAEEDAALRAGYEKHGTVWATIVKDPAFAAQNRRSTDLRDRFRNAFPDLYQAAGYKPRSGGKRKKLAATTDDMPHTFAPMMPERASRRKRANTVCAGDHQSATLPPDSATATETDDSSDEEEGPSIRHSSPMADIIAESSRFKSSTSSMSEQTDSFLSSHHALSPDASASEYFLPVAESSSSHRMDTVGKSAWAHQDWMSANPRMGSRAPSVVQDSASSAASVWGTTSPAPSSPFSSAAQLHASFEQQQYGIFDRYGLTPLMHDVGGMGIDDFQSEAGVGDTRSAFSDEQPMFLGGFRGFTHHSDTAGDLIFGTRSGGRGVGGASHAHPGFNAPLSLLGAMHLDDHENKATPPNELSLDDLLHTDVATEGGSLIDGAPINEAEGEGDPAFTSTPPATPVKASQLKQLPMPTQPQPLHARSFSQPPSAQRRTSLGADMSYLSMHSLTSVASPPPMPHTQSMPPPGHPHTLPTHSTAQTQTSSLEQLGLLPYFDTSSAFGELPYPWNGESTDALDLARPPSPRSAYPTSFVSSLGLPVYPTSDALDLAQPTPRMRSMEYTGTGVGLPHSSSAPPYPSNYGIRPYRQRGQSQGNAHSMLSSISETNKRKRNSWDGGVS